MTPNAAQSSRQPLAGRMSSRALTSSVKRSVLSMSMRFSYDSRIRVVVTSGWSIGNFWTSTSSTTCITNSVQELLLTRDTPQHA